MCDVVLMLLLTYVWCSANAVGIVGIWVWNAFAEQKIICDNKRRETERKRTAHHVFVFITLFVDLYSIVKYVTRSWWVFYGMCSVTSLTYISICCHTHDICTHARDTAVWCLFMSVLVCMWIESVHETWNLYILATVLSCWGDPVQLMGCWDQITG